MEIPHANFAEITGMVLVDVCSVMMLSTSHTTTTRMLSMLAYATMSGRDMATTVLTKKNQLKCVLFEAGKRGGHEGLVSQG